MRHDDKHDALPHSFKNSEKHTRIAYLLCNFGSRRAVQFSRYRLPMEAATLLFLTLRNLKQKCAYISAPGLLCSPILELTPDASTFSKREGTTSMSSRLPWLAGALVLASLAAGIAPASAAETGTKTMPDSSIYPPPTPPPVFDTSPRRECSLPSGPCDDNHRVDN